MSAHAAHPSDRQAIERTRWRIDPANSSVTFRVRKFWGLVTVEGSFERYDGTLDLSGRPAVEMTIDADSLSTKLKKRDEHLRSRDFFDVKNHPHIRFTAECADVDGERLTASGRLRAAGGTIPLEVEAKLRRVDEQIEIDASASADHRRLGMTWSPLGMLRTPSKLSVRGRLMRVS